MTSTSETGHVKNVANFATLISKCKGFGQSYNPSKTTLSITALTTLQTSAQDVINKLNLTLPAHKNAIAARATVLKSLDKLITRVVNFLKSVSPSAKTTENVISITRKLKGQRASAKLTEEELKTMKTNGKEIRQVSTSQLGIDNRIDNLAKLINQLTAIIEYKPNEKDLQVATLTALLTDLKAKNSAAIEATTPVNNARIARNDVLYKPETGLVDIALSVKNYVKSVFGTTSPQYKQISSLAFKRYKV